MIMKKLLLGAGACALALAAVALNANAPVETKAEGTTKCFYIATGSGTSWDNRYIYAFGSENEFGAWPGKKVGDVAACTVSANFGHDRDSYWNGGIFKVTYDSSKTSTFILHNNAGQQTTDIPVSEGACYFYDGYETYNVKDDAGKAAAVVFDFDAALGVPGTICSGGGAFEGKNDSEKCAIMAPLYSEYLAALYDDDGSVAGWLNPSTLTNGDHGLEYVATTTFKDVLYRNGYVFGNDGSYSEPSPVKSVETIGEDNRIGLFIGSCAVVASGIAIAFFGIKRRQSEND